MMMRRKRRRDDEALPEIANGLMMERIDPDLGAADDPVETGPRGDIHRVGRVGLRSLLPMLEPFALILVQRPTSEHVQDLRPTADPRMGMSLGSRIFRRPSSRESFSGSIRRVLVGSSP